MISTTRWLVLIIKSEDTTRCSNEESVTSERRWKVSTYFGANVTWIVSSAISKLKSPQSHLRISSNTFPASSSAASVVCC
ncbi:hypothetical protein L1987_71623 [Smallanthus sonchifolius]|uniref:Uncharacterized protein n=1 Tax=Smallanthus sonchifolius TaxID=185202 RepID=A0ACB9ATA1_9ASTR|nr:hypothetical protein L1987_71623 [Smallanthus sonchifolius]